MSVGWWYSHLAALKQISKIMSMNLTCMKQANAIFYAV